MDHLCTHILVSICWKLSFCPSVTKKLNNYRIGIFKEEEGKEEEEGGLHLFECSYFFHLWIEPINCFQYSISQFFSLKNHWIEKIMFPLQNNFRPLSFLKRIVEKNLYNRKKLVLGSSINYKYICLNLLSLYSYFMVRWYIHTV